VPVRGVSVGSTIIGTALRSVDDVSAYFPLPEMDAGSVRVEEKPMNDSQSSVCPRSVSGVKADVLVAQIINVGAQRPNVRDRFQGSNPKNLRLFVVAMALLAGGCSGGGGAGVPITPNSGGIASLTNARAITAQSVATGHVLDNTGCLDFPSGDLYNRPVTNAPLASKSATYITQAMSHDSGGMGIAGPYHYQVVPVNAPTVTVRPKISYHSFPYPWPIPADGQQLASTSDANMLLIQQTSPACTAWEGYSFSLSGSTWSGYSGGKVSMGSSMPHEVCSGAEGLCGENFEGDLTYYEATAGQPILHAFHMEVPSNVICDPSSFTNCIPIGGRIRLHGSYPEPSDRNAKAVIDALKTYGGDAGDNGCCWNIYGLNTLQQSNSYPSAILSAIRGLHWSDFDVVVP
jgi:hypothetical protein